MRLRAWAVSRAGSGAASCGNDGLCDGGGACRFYAGGTVCAVTVGVTGEDRRLGDYFTVNTDSRGCLNVATGDTKLTDAVTGNPSPNSHPMFIRQNSGPGLTGQTCG